MAAKTPKKSPKKSPKKTPKKTPAKSPSKTPAKTPKSVKKAIKKTPKTPKSPKSPSGPELKVGHGVKDPNAPKRALSAYFCFMIGERDNLIKKYKLDPKSIADVGKKVGEVWGTMSDKDKAPFQAKADKDKVRYDKEIAKYVPDPSKFIVKRGAGKKAKKDPNAPKRGLSAYMCFIIAERGNIIKKYKLDPKSIAEIGKQAGVVWGSLSDKDKAPWQAKATKDKARYDKEKAAYDKKNK